MSGIRTLARLCMFRVWTVIRSPAPVSRMMNRLASASSAATCTRLNSPASSNGNSKRFPPATLPSSTPDGPIGSTSGPRSTPRRMPRSGGSGPHRLAATACACSPRRVRNRMLNGAVGGCALRTVTVAVSVTGPVLEP
ncbi:hypothetical protein [Mycobacterium genavense]|uniref:hypothetical protein n=1 Tax=Mycobacterium genavense TaxID=36812 RepID=UPI000A06DFCA|nr:hypothetical protein [Mycobacterium genavense]